MMEDVPVVIDKSSARKWRQLFLELPDTIRRRLLELVPSVRMELCYADETLAPFLKVQIHTSKMISLTTLVSELDAERVASGRPDMTLNSWAPCMVVKESLDLWGGYRADVDVDFFQIMRSHIYCPHLRQLKLINGVIDFQLFKRFLCPTLTTVCVHLQMSGFDYSASALMEILELVPLVETFIFMPGGTDSPPTDERIEQWKSERNLKIFHVRIHCR